MNDSASHPMPGKQTVAAVSPVRMIALDLDGTLLRTDKSIGQKNAAALRAAHARGLKIVMASGRMAASMERIASALGVDVCLISCNGAEVHGEAGLPGTRSTANMSPRRKRLFYQPLNAAVAREVVAYGKAHRYQVNFYHDDLVYSEDAPELRPWIEIYRSRTNSPFQFVKNLDDYLHLAPPKVLYVVDPRLRGAIQKELEPRFGSRVTMMRTDPEYLEFLEPGIDKGVGLARLAEVLGIPMGQVMAVGDGENDIPMLAVAGWPVAVANAGPLCRAVARFFTRNDNDHDAVAEAVDRWVL
ncbi:MAG: Cof-type HAD-IIB family hydrolase [Planctomycetota bacterium]|nr:Cof-type HAD-IIB family hydrolase [Planctomycetota bacterium]